MAISRIIVLFNLKPGQSAADYETWARTTDLVTVKALKSIADFKVYEATGLLGSEAKPPYQYVEIIDVADMAVFGDEVGTETMQRVAAEFQGWADPIFITTRDIESAA
jgi:hypothetical protein